MPPDSVETFIRLLRSRNDKLQEELVEAEDAVRSTSQHENFAVAVEEKDEEDDLSITAEVKEKVMLFMVKIVKAGFRGDWCGEVLSWDDFALLLKFSAPPLRTFAPPVIILMK